MNNTTTIKLDLQRADAFRRAGQWQEALSLYQTVAQTLESNPLVFHNIALCQLALGNHDAAHRFSVAAFRLSPQLWQSALIQVKSLAGLGRRAEAYHLNKSLFLKFRDKPPIRSELASLALHYAGNALLARQLVRTLLSSTDESERRDAWLTTLISELYEQSLPSDVLAAEFQKFARDHLKLSADEQVPERFPARKRPRIGLISPQFFASPVFFFTLGPLRELAKHADLVFFDRGNKTDWATDALRSLACDWVACADLDAGQLREALLAQQLNGLVDLAGWMDPVALKALSTKPAARMVKWVGGQSITTGLDAFDAWITDRYQTSPAQQSYYSEPLVAMTGGYVTYSPPDYLPGPCDIPDDTVRLGVVANPAKVGSRFLQEVAAFLQRNLKEAQRPMVLVFIDRRYEHSDLRERVTKMLPAPSARLAYEFITPTGHQEYLEAVAGVHVVLDTFPYSGGLTTIEAMAMGVPCLLGDVGELFCQRHTYAHAKYAKLDGKKMTLQSFSIDTDLLEFPQRQALAESIRKRSNHKRLAGQLLSLLTVGAGQ